MTIQTVTRKRLVDNDYLKDELTGLLRYIHRVRQEIAAIDNPAEEEHNFESMGEQLDAIVKATEQATNRIMEAVERNTDLVEKIRDNPMVNEVNAMLDQIIDNNNDVFEACSFQDITGQRVNKVVKSITYVEDRVNALVEVWGKDELAKVTVAAPEKTEDEKLLDGPQLEGKGLSQDEVDALFD